MDYTISENENGTQFVQIEPEHLNKFIADFELNNIEEIDDSMNKSLNFVEMTIDNAHDEAEVTRFNFAVSDLKDDTPFSEMQEEFVSTNPFREFEDAPLEEEEV